MGRERVKGTSWKSWALSATLIRSGARRHPRSSCPPHRARARSAGLSLRSFYIFITNLRGTYYFALRTFYNFMDFSTERLSFPLYLLLTLWRARARARTSLPPRVLAKWKSRARLSFRGARLPSFLSFGWRLWPSILSSLFFSFPFRFSSRCAKGAFFLSTQHFFSRGLRPKDNSCAIVSGDGIKARAMNFKQLMDLIYVIYELASSPFMPQLPTCFFFCFLNCSYGNGKISYRSYSFFIKPFV